MTGGGQVAAPKRNDAWIVLILVWCALTVVSALYVTLPMISDLAASFHTSSAAAGWASSSFSLAYAAGFLLFGPLSERVGRKQMMLAGLIVLSLITLFLGMANSLPRLITLRAIQGLAAATFAPAVLAYVAEAFPPERNVTIVGFVSTGFLTAGIAGQVFSSLVGHYGSWPAVFYLLAVSIFLPLFSCGDSFPRDRSGGLKPNGCLHSARWAACFAKDRFALATSLPSLCF